MLQNHRMETGSFSSANLDRIERGVYRLRVETFRNFSDEIRTDTLLNFDRELNITIREVGRVPVFRVQNLRTDIIVQDIRIRGILSGRSNRIIDVFHGDMHLYQDQESWDIGLDTSNLSTLSEVRDSFILDFIELTFCILEGEETTSGVVVLRYDARYDRYRIIEDLRQINEQDESENNEIDEGEYTIEDNQDEEVETDDSIATGGDGESNTPSTDLDPGDSDRSNDLSDLNEPDDPGEPNEPDPDPVG